MKQSAIYVSLFHGRQKRYSKCDLFSDSETNMNNSTFKKNTSSLQLWNKAGAKSLQADPGITWCHWQCDQLPCIYPVTNLLPLFSQVSCPSIGKVLLLLYTLSVWDGSALPLQKAAEGRCGDRITADSFFKKSLGAKVGHVENHSFHFQTPFLKLTV